MDKEFRGNAYIVKAGEVLLNYSGGFADIANEIPNTFETRFESASMGKTFVAVGILQLIEEEKLRFEDTIGVILDFDLKQIDPDVTVRQLLNHTSGVPDYFDEAVMDDYEALWNDYPNYSSTIIPDTYCLRRSSKRLPEWILMFILSRMFSTDAA